MRSRIGRLFSHRRTWAIVLLATVLLVGGGVAWEHFHQTPTTTALPPEIPTTVHDPDIVAALKLARNSVLSTPQSGQAWGELGLVFRAHRLTAQSSFCFVEASRLDPTNPRWPYLLGFHHLLNGSENPIPYFQSAYTLAIDPAYKSAARLRLAETFLDRNELANAEKLFGEDVSVNPQNPRSQFGLAVLACRRGDYRTAIVFLKQAENPPVHQQIAATLAMCHRQLGEIAVAEKLEREAGGKVDEAWPDPYIAEYSQRETGYESRLRAAGDLQSKGRWYEAVSILEELVRTNPDDQALVSLGYNLLQLRQFRQAEQVLRLALAKNPDRAHAHDYLGLVFSMQAEERWKAGDQGGAIPLFEAAVIEFRQAIKLNTKDGLTHLRAGLALKYLGRLSEAIDEYRAALQAKPEYALIHQEMGEVLLQMNKPTEAIPFLEEAIRLAPPNDSRAKRLLEEAKSKLP
jgi:tetratricopeptide (TPR) repeat protein